MTVLLYTDDSRVLTRILKTGFIESIPGKSWVKIEKLEFYLEKLEFLVLAEIWKVLFADVMAFILQNGNFKILVMTSWAWTKKILDQK